METIKEILGENGLISDVLEGYESRKPQIVFAEKVLECFEKNVHLIAEVPTGGGKGLAYLSAAMLRICGLAKAGEVRNRDFTEHDMDDVATGLSPKSEKQVMHAIRKRGNRCVVVTANIALQEQLYKKDLPFFSSVFPGGIEYALVKGRNNYFCKTQYAEWLENNQQGVFTTVDTTSNVERKIAQWGQKTETGDKEEIDFAITDEAWSKFCVTAEDCLGDNCDYRDGCFAQRARAALQRCDIIIANYHLFFSAVKLRKETGKDIVLPAFDYLVLDEAHEAADIARQFFGWSLSNWQLNRLCSHLQKLRDAAKNELDVDCLNHMGEVANRLETETDLLWDALEMHFKDAKGSVRLLAGNKISPLSLAASLRAACVIFKDVADKITNVAEKEKVFKSSDRCIKFAGYLEELEFHLDNREERDENAVYFLDRVGKQKKIRIEKRVVDVSDMLWNDVFCKTKSACLTSATLMVEGDDTFVRKDVGLREAESLVVDSPFNYRNQGLLIVSENAPDPTAKDYQQRILPVLLHIIKEAKGRTLCLFTSYRNLSAAAEYLGTEDIGCRLLVQGDAPRMQLLRQFKEDVNSVLLGTDSFWTGVDIPGQSLSCLVIDKLPFPAPGDPVLDAIGEKCTQKGQNAFWVVSTPRAILKFRQGIGRLIRRRTDVGVAVVLDRRLITKGYGEMFLNSLPGFTVAYTLKGNIIQKWLAKAEKDKNGDGELQKDSMY